MSNPNENHPNNKEDNKSTDEQIRTNNLFTYDISYKKQLEEEPKHKLNGFDNPNLTRNQIEYRPEDLNYMKSQSFFYKSQLPNSQPPSNNPYTYGDFYANNYTKNSFSPQEYEYMASIRMQKEARRKPKIRVCTNCSTTNTPSWRRSKDGRLLLCNACGLYAKLHGRPRPFSKSIDGRTKALKPHFERFTCYNCRLSGPKLFIQSNNGMLICRQCGEPEQWSLSYRNYSQPQEGSNYYQPQQQHSMYNNQMNNNQPLDTGFNSLNMLKHNEISFEQNSSSQFNTFYQNNNKLNSDIKPKNIYPEKHELKKVESDNLLYQDSFFEEKPYSEFEPGNIDEDMSL